MQIQNETSLVKVIYICILGKNICEVGGPIVYRSSPNENFHQVGLVSYGSTIYCGSQTPLVYTKISGFLDWLDKNLEE